MLVGRPTFIILCRFKQQLAEVAPAKIPASKVSTEISAAEVASAVIATSVCLRAIVSAVIATGILSCITAFAVGITFLVAVGKTVIIAGVPEELVGDHAADEHASHAAEEAACHQSTHAHTAHGGYVAEGTLDCAGLAHLGSCRHSCQGARVVLVGCRCLPLMLRQSGS